MANKNFKKINSIKDTEGGGFGTYDEHKGGGTPKGGVWGGKSGRVGWDEREKSGELKAGDHRQDQARTKDGKFTYNSVNGKETKYESRGETVNPLLTGGENGVKIKDVEKQFSEKKGDLYDKYKGNFFQKGSKLITKEGRKYVVKLAANDVWEIARSSFDISTGSFKGEAENFGETKLGRRSKDEKEAIQGAKKAKGEQFAKGGLGEIATRKYSDDEKAKISSDREARREFVEYLKGKYGRTSRAFAPSGTSDSLSPEEKKSIVDSAKKSSVSRMFRKMAAPKAAPAPEAAPTPTPTPTAAPKTSTSAVPSEAIIPEKAPEGKVYKYEKASNVPTLKAGTKYGEDVSKKVSDQINAMEDMSDEDKEMVKTILTTKSPEEIDAFIDDLINSGFIAL